MSSSQVQPSPPPANQPERPPAHHFQGWQRRLLGFCFSLFALEVGLFLVVFPWRDSWDLNWIPIQNAKLRLIWMSPYFRGFVSGLGLLDIYIAFAEAIKQLKSLLGHHVG